MIAPIGQDDSATRVRSDRVFDRLIRPAVEPLGYSCLRADHIRLPGSVVLQVSELLVRAELVIADLTGSNANVFYELGIRHAIGRPFIQLVQVNDEIPFDVTSVRTVFIDTSSEHAIQTSINAIASHVRSAESNPAIPATPISTLFDVTVSPRPITVIGPDMSVLFQHVLRMDYEADQLSPLLSSPFILAAPKKWHTLGIDPATFSTFGWNDEASIALTAMLPIVASHATEGAYVSETPFRVLHSNATHLHDGLSLPSLDIFYTLSDQAAIIHHVAHAGFVSGAAWPTVL